MNQAIFRAINELAGHWGWLDALMIFCAQYLLYLAVVVVLLIWLRRHYLKTNRWRDLALVSIASAVIGRLIVAEPFKLLYYHPRPYWVLSNVHLLLARETESSFPSGHTIFMFALAAGVYLYNKKAGWWFFGAAVLVGFARVFVGVHWPYDIIGGAVLGIPTALACNWLYKKYFKTIIDRWI
ncbi:MAG TPA: phosphatase PAP2 family protein [Candidatus Paceibacterota bacterium]|nr:phosphatase PAP2 family protein [Candidatus Paceibacterota bacterium]